MRPARQSQSFLKQLQVAPFLPLEMMTTGNVRDEIFSSLEYLTEIEEIGLEFLRRRGQTRGLRSTYQHMQAFVRQAKKFYEAAEDLHYRASPLIYYYSFLNLAKAYVCVTNPTAVQGRVYHGLTVPPRRSKGPLGGIILTNIGVFSLLYKEVTGVEIPRNSPIKLVDLLGYCSDVAVEYGLGGFGRHRLTRGRISISVEQQRGAYCLIGITDFGKFDRYKKSLSKFNQYFEEVDLPQHTCREIFDVYAEEQSHYRFFESRNTIALNQQDRIPTSRIVAQTVNALQPILEPICYRGEGDFRLVEPLRRNQQLPMRQSLAIYAAMFYLGSLVRYNPAYLEHMLESREAWIIERFTKTAPITFLRQIRNLIDGRNFIYVAR